MFVDLKAPRFNSRSYNVPIITKELHSFWKKKTGRKDNFNSFKKIWEDIAYEFKEAIYEEPDGLRLPGLGDMYIGYAKSSKRYVDYKTSKELGKTIYFENWHSGGRGGKLIYGTKDRPYIYGMDYMWAFAPCREFSRSVAKAIKANPDRYKITQEKRLKGKIHESIRNRFTNKDQATSS